MQWSGKSTYLVYMTEGGHEMVVDMKNHTCAWRENQLTRISCYHPCACINLSNLDISEHIHKTIPSRTGQERVRTAHSEPNRLIICQNSTQDGFDSARLDS